jgi:hypothetical protein
VEAWRRILSKLTTAQQNDESAASGAMIRAVFNDVTFAASLFRASMCRGLVESEDAGTTDLTASGAESLIYEAKLIRQPACD